MLPYLIVPDGGASLSPRTSGALTPELPLWRAWRNGGWGVWSPPSRSPTPQEKGLLLGMSPEACGRPLPPWFCRALEGKLSAV